MRRSLSLCNRLRSLWFKQILFDLHRVIDDLTGGRVLDAVRLLVRLGRIMNVLREEVDILALMPPRAFHGFRGVLSPSVGSNRTSSGSLSTRPGWTTQLL